MKEKLRDKNLYALELPYKILYFIFAFFTFCNLTFMKPIMSVAVMVVLVFGVLVAFPRLYNIKGYLKIPSIFFAVGFLCSYLISAILNYKYGYVDNFKYFIWMGLHFFTIFACDVNRSTEDYKKEFKVISIFFMGVMFVMSTASLVELCMNYHLEEYLPTHTHLAGLVWGRLWGVFTDPNYGSVFAVLCILFSVYFFKNNKNVPFRIFLGVNIFIQIAYMAFSDSRTGLVTLLVCIFMYTLLLGIRNFKFKKSLNAVVSIGLALVISVTAVAGVTLTKKAGGAVIQKFYEQTEENTDNKVEVPQIDDEQRNEDLKNDVSNRRFDIWKSGIEIFSSKPVFGVSYYNIKEYALREMPETYLVNNDHGKFSNMHNIIFNILAGQGVVGILVFLSFAIYSAIYVLRRLFKLEGEDYDYMVILVTCISACFVASMFVTDVVYVNSPISLTFWLFLGYVFHFFKRKEMGKN